MVVTLVGTIIKNFADVQFEIYKSHHFIYIFESMFHDICMNCDIDNLVY